MEAGTAIGSYLRLTGQWGLDFVIDQETQTPVVVDLNMGRPNGNLSYFLWRSTKLPPAGVLPSPLQLTQISQKRRAPPDEMLEEFVALLEREGLMWSEGCVEGVVPCQYNPGFSSTLLCVSWKGRAAAEELATRLREADPRGKYWGESE